MPLLSFNCCLCNLFFKTQRGGNMRVQDVGCRQNEGEWSIEVCSACLLSSRTSSFKLQLDQAF
jgi:hypothetical protein